MTYRVTITQTKSALTPEGVNFFDPSNDFKTLFQSWIDAGNMTEVQNNVSEDGSQKVSVVEFPTEELHNNFIAQSVSIEYVTLRNTYNSENKINFNRVGEVV